MKPALVVDRPGQAEVAALDLRLIALWIALRPPEDEALHLVRLQVGAQSGEVARNTEQRRVSRRKKGSNRRRKAVTLLAKAHQTVRRQRADFHHKTALALVRANDTMYHEDLQTANMLKNHRLAKSISDAGWAAFVSILAAKAAKAAYAGRRIVAVPPAYTSQVCSDCGVPVAKGLSVRWHACPG